MEFVLHPSDYDVGLPSDFDFSLVEARQQRAKIGKAQEGINSYSTQDGINSKGNIIGIGNR